MMKMNDQQKYAGMSVNERLFEAGLVADFDLAIEHRDLPKIRHILAEVYVDEASIELFVKQVSGSAS